MHVPIVVLSTSSSNADIHSCYKAGINGYVVKPYDIEKLFEDMCITFKWWLEVNKLVDERYE
jgi:AmiR/NasT family two-component response regulator